MKPKPFENDIESQLSRSSCSKRHRLEPLFNQHVAGLAVVAERNLIRVLGKYAEHNTEKASVIQYKVIRNSLSEDKKINT